MTNPAGTSAQAPRVRYWVIVFAIPAVIYFLGAFCWLFIDPVPPLEQLHELHPIQKPT